MIALALAGKPLFQGATKAVIAAFAMFSVVMLNPWGRVAVGLFFVIVGAYFEPSIGTLAGFTAWLTLAKKPLWKFVSAVCTAWAFAYVLQELPGGIGVVYGVITVGTVILLRKQWKKAKKSYSEAIGAKS